MAKKTVTPGKGLQKPVQPSNELSVILGSKKPLARPKVLIGLWDYIKSNDLQSGRDITLNDDLRDVFGTEQDDPACVAKGKMTQKEYSTLVKKIGKSGKMTMFEMNKLLSNHLFNI